MNLIYNSGYVLSRLAATAFFSYRAHDTHQIPEEGGVILAANHSSYLDPPLVGIASKRAVWFLARKTLLEWPVLGPVFPSLNVIPVDRDGNDRSALKIIIRLLREGEGVVLFPEGTRSTDGNLQPGQPGIGMVVAKTGVPVVPARVFGAFEAFPKGGKIPSFHPIDVCFGPPLYFGKEIADDSSRESYQKISDRIMGALAAIDPPART